MAARIPIHRAGAGGVVENRGDFVVCAGTPAVDDGAAGDQGSGARYYDVALGSIVVKDSVRTRGTGPFLAARCRGVRRRSGRGGCATVRARTAWAFPACALN